MTFNGLQRASRLLPAAVTAAIVMAACSSDEEVRPTIKLLSPVDGSTVDSRTLDVTIELERFTLSPVIYDPENNEDSVPFVGHWHLFVDFEFLGDVYSHTATVTNVDPGEHSVIAQLVNQNHFPISGTPYAEAIITIPAGANGITITNPPSGTVVSSSSTDILIEVEGFVLDSAGIGAPNEFDHGHYHVFVENEFVGEGTAPSFNVTTLVTSTQDVGNAVSVELVNNDHTPVLPAVTDLIEIVTAAGSPYLKILQPMEGATVPSNAELVVDVRNFSLVDFAGTTSDSAGSGHYHVLIDGADVGEAFSTSGLTLGFSPGEHDVRVELRGNLHQPLTPPVVDEVRVARP